MKPTSQTLPAGLFLGTPGAECPAYDDLARSLHEMAVIGPSTWTS